MQQIIDAVRGFDGALVVQPEPGSAFPEIAWGDAFFYFAPDGVTPERTQPYGTIVTKDYPDDTGSRLDEPGRFRVNVQVGRATARSLVEGDDPAEPDTFVGHPLYATAGWVSVVEPGARTSERLLALLLDAHRAAEARARRRHGTGAR